MRAIIVKFGRKLGLGAGRAGLLGVRRTDRNVQGSARVAKGGSEDVGGPQIGAKDEARNLGLSSVVTGLSSSVSQGGDLAVS